MNKTGYDESNSKFYRNVLLMRVYALNCMMCLIVRQYV